MLNPSCPFVKYHWFCLAILCLFSLSSFLSEYLMSYQSITGLNLGRLQYRENIDASQSIDASQETHRARLTGLEPKTDYRIYLTATTVKGKGEPIFLDARTLAAGSKNETGRRLISCVCVICEIPLKCGNFLWWGLWWLSDMCITEIGHHWLVAVEYWRWTGGKAMPEGMTTHFTDTHVHHLALIS